MNTRTLHRRPQVQPENLPPQCLLDPSPTSVEIVDSDDRPAKVGCAGFALYPGRSYRLRVSLPHRREAIDKVRIVNAPDFIKVEECRCETNGGGSSDWIVPFSTKGLSGFGIRSLLPGVPLGEIELLVYPNDPQMRPPPPMKLPVVVWRRAYAIIAALVLVGLCALVEKVVAASVLGDDSVRKSVRDLMLHFNARSLAIMAAVFAGIYLILYGIMVVQVWRRTREIHRRFVEQYPRPEEYLDSEA